MLGQCISAQNSVLTIKVEIMQMHSYLLHGRYEWQVF